MDPVARTTHRAGVNCYIRFEYIPSKTTDHVLPESADDSHN